MERHAPDFWGSVFARGRPRPLRPGMVFHTVPWVLLPGVGALGLSETWAVTEDGVDVLTETPRELRVVAV